MADVNMKCSTDSELHMILQKYRLFSYCLLTSTVVVLVNTML